MSCDTVREAMGDILDGNDPKIPDVAIRSHLEACRFCWEEIWDMALDWASLNRLLASIAKVPEGLEERLIEKTAPEIERRRRAGESPSP